MSQIDIAISKVCAICQTKTPLRYGLELVTISERSRLGMRIDPAEFTLCPTCGNPQYLHIQAQPYELVNHLDTPVALYMYEQQQKKKQGNTQ